MCNVDPSGVVVETRVDDIPKGFVRLEMGVKLGKRGDADFDVFPCSQRKTSAPERRHARSQPLTRLELRNRLLLSLFQLYLHTQRKASADPFFAKSATFFPRGLVVRAQYVKQR